MKRDLLHSLKIERTQLNNLFQDIINKGFADQIIEQNWTLKNVIVHVSYYEKEVVLLLQDRDIGKHPFWKTSIEIRNKEIFNSTHEKPLDTILTEANIIFNDLVTFVKKMTEDELDSIFKGMTRSIGSFIFDLSVGHYHEHDHKLIKRFNL